MGDAVPNNVGADGSAGSPPTTPAKHSARNLSIEGLRGVAAFLVLISHINGIAVKDKFAPAWQVWVDTELLSHLGAFGVCAFFCISGYLIVQSLMKYQDVGVFAFNRIKRIYPLFLAMHLVAFPAMLVLEKDFRASMPTVGEKVMHFFSNLLFLPGVWNLPIAQANAWSLSFEAIFYITSCFLFVGVKSDKGWMRVVSGTIGLTSALLLLFFRPYCWFFLMGALVYAMQVRQTSPRAWMVGPVGWIALVLAYISLPERGRLVSLMPMNPAATPMEILVELGPYPFAFGFSFLFFATVVFQRGWLAKWLQHPWLVFLGTISYSLYLVHPFVLHPMAMVVKKLNSPLAAYGFIVFGLVASVLISKWTYEWLEIRLGNWMFPKRLKPVVTA
ncbi:MAG: acyltransferase [Fimbriimonadaceae bacterium]|nr:acyltransferase [Fimbriimonadaceae bacterium]